MKLRTLHIRVVADIAYPVQLLIIGHPLLAIQGLLAMWKESADTNGFICIGSRQFLARSIQAIYIEGIR